MKNNKFVAFVAVVAAALTLFATFDPAEARRGGGHRSFSGGHRSFAVRSFSGPRFSSFSGARHIRVYPRHVRRGVIYGGIPLVGYGTYRYYRGDGCYWLKQKAMITGSHYWWRRYWACRNGVRW